MKDHNSVKVYFSEEKDDCICILLTDSSWFLYVFEWLYDVDNWEIQEMSLEKKG